MVKSWSYNGIDGSTLIMIMLNHQLSAGFGFNIKEVATKFYLKKGLLLEVV